MFGDAALGATNLAMIATSRSVGAAAKFTGSGGAVVALCPQGAQQEQQLQGEASERRELGRPGTFCDAPPADVLCCVQLQTRVRPLASSACWPRSRRPSTRLSQSKTAARTERAGVAGGTCHVCVEPVTASDTSNGSGRLAGFCGKCATRHVLVLIVQQHDARAATKQQQQRVPKQHMQTPR